MPDDGEFCLHNPQGTAVQTTAHGLGQFIGGRFILGFGGKQTEINAMILFLINTIASIASAAGPAYTVELAHPCYRGTMAGMYNNCKLRETCKFFEIVTDSLSVWWLGNIIAGWTTYGTDKNFPGSSWAWRTPTVVQCVLPAVVMSMVLFFPGRFFCYFFFLSFTQKVNDH